MITLLSILLILSFIAIIILVTKAKTKVIIPNVLLQHNEEKFFSEAVLDLLKDVVNHPELYEYKNHTFGKAGDSVSNSIEVWMCNEIQNRRFYTQNISLQEKVKELNSKLTKYDLILLDKIGKSLSEHKEFPTYIKIS